MLQKKKTNVGIKKEYNLRTVNAAQVLFFRTAPQKMWQQRFVKRVVFTCLSFKGLFFLN